MPPLEMLARQAEWSGRSFAHNLGFIPEAKFDWKPEPTANSAQEIVNHIGTILRGAVSVLQGGEFKPEPVDVKTRAAAQELIGSLATQQAAGLRQVQEADFSRIITLPFGDVPLERAALMSVIDFTHHHGQIVYLQELLGDTEMHMAPPPTTNS